MTVPALIDSGASGTLIPESVVSGLSLRKIGERRASGVYSPPRMVPIYKVDLDFVGFDFQNHPVSTQPRDYALIGRDVLNRYLTELNGPRLEFSAT